MTQRKIKARDEQCVYCSIQLLKSVPRGSFRKKIFSLLVISSLLFLSGCNTDEFSRYPSVIIPQFSEEDYYSLLSNPNSEIVYNAVCVLGMQAKDIGKTLSDEKVDRASSEFTRALNIYRKITQLLSHDDPRVVAASLRFLQLFCNNYDAKNELIKPIAAIESSNILVQYEQVATLSLLANKDSVIPDELLRKFLKTSSWIVSRSAYQLVNNLEHEQLRGELIEKYQKVTEEKEKLLILTALEKNFNDPVAEFLFSEFFSTNSTKIRHAILDMLDSGKNSEKILRWIASNYDQIVSVEGEYLFVRHASTMDQKFSSQIIRTFLGKGFSVDGNFLEQLNEGLEHYQNKAHLADEEKEKLSNLLEIEKAVLHNGSLSQEWKALREKTVEFNVQVEKLQSEYDNLAQDFAVKVDELFKKYNISDEKRQEQLKSINDSGEGLRNYLSH